MVNKWKHLLRARTTFLPKKPLELVHINLFGQTKARSTSDNKYVFIIVDDFTRYILVLFLKSKDVTIYEFVKFLKKVENKKGF